MTINLKAIAIIAEAKIDAAIEMGEFDDLPGFGEPLSDDLLQHDPNWWIRRKLRREQLAHLLAPSPKITGNSDADCSSNRGKATHE